MWKKKELLVTIIVLLFLGISFDLYSFCFSPIISVKSEYIYYIFAAHSTVAAISATILAVVVNSLNSQYYGYSIKEITNFKNDYLSISSVIPLSLFSILISSGLLAFEFLNSIIVIMICVILLISNSSEFSWKLLSDDDFCERIVLDQIELSLSTNNSEPQLNLISKVFESLNSEIIRNGIMNVEKHLNLINHLVKAENTTIVISESLERNIKKTFGIATKIVGFIPAIDKILPLYEYVGKDMKYFEIQSILSNQLESVQFLNDSELHRSSFLEISNGFENNIVMSDNLKIFIYHDFFENIYRNEVISNVVKTRILSNLLVHVSTFNWMETMQYESFKQKTLLYIFRDFILLNKNIDDSKQLFYKILKPLYSDGVSSNEKLFETISLIYLSLYLYCESEVETITKEHRIKLKELFGSYEKEVHTVKISFNFILREYFPQITNSLLNLPAATYTEYSFLEYFPPQFGAKALVWQKSAGITFAMFNYLLSDYVFKELPHKMITNWNDIEDKVNYIRIMLGFFDPWTKTLRADIQSKLKNISLLIEQNMILNDGNLKWIFENLNKDMQLLEGEDLKIEFKVQISSDKINALFKEQLLIKNKHYGFNSSIALSEVEGMYFRPFIDDVEHLSNMQSMSDIIFRYFEIFLRNQVDKVFKEVSLSFNTQGVKILLWSLKNGKFDMRNYTFIDDWAFSSAVRESSDFRELVKLIENTKKVDNMPINSHIFFKDGFMDYNFVVTSYNIEPLNDEESSVYVENFKIGEGIYKVREAYYPKVEAMKIIKNRYGKLKIQFKFASNFKAEKGIRIKLSYN